MLEPGLEPVAGYRLIEPLGAGAFGIVWEARDREDRPVALKFLDCRGRYRDLVATEVRVLRALAGLSHPNIIKLINVHASARYLVLVMEKADCNLDDLLQSHRKATNGNVPAERVLHLLAQAAESLDFLAELKLTALGGARGLQHCDVKPTNLLLIGDCLKVADFGLCAGNGWHTQSGNGWRGTWPYAAPELYYGRPAPGTDQYALAITYCQLVMGSRPFWPGARPSDPPASPAIDLTKVRDGEVCVLARALHAQPSLRYPNCRAFIDALHKAMVAPRTPRDLAPSGERALVAGAFPVCRQDRR